jgi:hypothetical protein
MCSEKMPVLTHVCVCLCRTLYNIFVFIRIRDSEERVYKCTIWQDSLYSLGNVFDGSDYWVFFFSDFLDIVTFENMFHKLLTLLSSSTAATWCQVRSISE